jgi:hypothetical protein
LPKSGSPSCSRDWRRGSDAHRYTTRSPPEPKAPPAKLDAWKFVKGRSILGGDRDVNVAEVERETGLTSLRHRLLAGWTPEIAKATPPMAAKIKCRLARASKKIFPRY